MKNIYGTIHVLRVGNSAMMKLPKTIKGRAKFDATVLAILFVVCFAFLSEIEAFESLIQFVGSHESWQLDELITSLALLGLGGFIFSARRYADAMRELKQRESAEAEVNWLAHFDPLTDLPNRRMLNEFVRKFDRSETSRRKDAGYAVYSIDLDGFKKVNDLHGHAAGDEVLKIVAQRLTTLFPKDLIVRLGGDEFLVVAKTHQRADVRKIANEMIQELVAPMDLHGKHAEIGASIGIVLYPSQVSTMEDAIRCGDIAMYAAKKSTASQVVFFQEDLRQDAEEKALLESELRIALAQDRIVPFYQPLVDLESGEIYGFEVLARWSLPNGDAVAPSVFIPLAEEAGLISDLSEKLLRKACGDAMGWSADIMLSFNLSPTQLSDRLIGLRIVNVLNETGFAPHRLEVEITESAMILDSETAIFILDGLQALGIRVALDDFGTGYSSLSQMSKFKFNRLKIDQSFIRDFEHDEKQNNIVKAIIALGNGLSVATTAEGIEAPSQLAALKSLGCNSGQGYLLGKPMTAELASAALAAMSGTAGDIQAQG
jgi:diguanylate cyclase (GGDEF)-like protein